MTMSAELKARSFEMYWRRDSGGRYVFRVQDVIQTLGLKGSSWLMRTHLRRALDVRCAACSVQIVVAGRADLRAAEEQGLCPFCAAKVGGGAAPARKLDGDPHSRGDTA